MLRATTACTFSKLHISASKSGPNPWCFCAFRLRNVLRRHNGRALFREELDPLSLQKCSEPLVFLTFCTSKCASRHNGVHFFDIATSKSGPTLLRATTACTFSTSQLPKVLRTPSAFNILTSKCASRHNDVHFFDIATSKSGPIL